ncbi:hypothetical protein FRC06_008230, partial [Ceratobasidium sp. 370]
VELPPSPSDASFDTVKNDLIEHIFTLQLSSTEYHFARHQLGLYEELINAHTGAQYRHLPLDDRLYLLSLAHIEYPTPPPSIHAPAMSNTGGASNPTPANTSAIIISDRNYSISKLEGHDNYPIWRIQMEDMFQDADVWDI